MEIMTSEQIKDTFQKASENYAHKEASKKLNPKEWNDYLLHHNFTGEDLYNAYLQGCWFGFNFCIESTPNPDIMI